MKVFELRIEGINELRVLHRMIMEAKFARDPVNKDISGSPLAAAVSDRVVDAIVAAERDSGGEDAARQWEIWRQISPDRREWSIALNRIEPGEPWRSWNCEKRTRFVEILLSPLKASPELINVFIKEVDSRVG